MFDPREVIVYQSPSDRLMGFMSTAHSPPIQLRTENSFRDLGKGSKKERMQLVEDEAMKFIINAEHENRSPTSNAVTSMVDMHSLQGHVGPCASIDKTLLHYRGSRGYSAM